MHALEAISPVDGRYWRYTEPLSPHFSELALMRCRLWVEVHHLRMLSGIGPRVIRDEEQAMLVRIPTEFELEQAIIIKQIETKGWEGYKRTNHDVKAVELYLRHVLGSTSLVDCLEWIHFALTSEDVNNISYAMMLTEGVTTLLRELEQILQWIDFWAAEYAHLAMLARTHGQPASPTTLGKEMRVYAERLRAQIEQLRNYRLLVKFNGATGNYNAHTVGLPKVDWLNYSQNFVTTFNQERGYRFRLNSYTTQIEPHDTFAEQFAILHRINVILTDFCQDVWRYVSDEWIVQMPVEGEAGSSTMPNKVNPIDFENSEGNAGLANALFEFYNRTLPVSRLQRHLSDSTIIRTFGTAFGHCLIAYRALLNGMGKISPNQQQIATDLDAKPEVLAEAFQTILRRAGYPDAYGQLKDLTRGKPVTLQILREFASGLQVEPAVRNELLELTPSSYTGLACYLAEGLKQAA